MTGDRTIVAEQQDEPQPAADAATEPAVPYEFSAEHVPFAVETVDRALREGGDTWTAALAVSTADAGEDLGDLTALRRELCRALTYSLHLGLGDEEPGCELNTDGNDLLPAVRDLPEPVIQLWRAVADGATEPATVARFADLLWCRRIPEAGLHAARAARAYLQLAATGDIDMDTMDFLLRAWTLARRIGAANLDQQTHARLAQVASDVLTNHPGERPGILLTALGALARGPLRAKKAPPSPDPSDVDDLLTRAAAACQRGNDASTVARHRRSRTQDPAALDAIARDEAAAYFRDAEAAPHPAVRMARLHAATRIAHDRGLSDLERQAAAAMQNIDPATLGWQTFTASTTLPAYSSLSRRKYRPG